MPDSDVLKMLQNTKISSNQQPGGGAFSKLQDSLSNEGMIPLYLYELYELFKHLIE